MFLHTTIKFYLNRQIKQILNLEIHILCLLDTSTSS